MAEESDSFAILDRQNGKVIEARKVDGSICTKEIGVYETPKLTVSAEGHLPMRIKSDLE